MNHLSSELEACLQADIPTREHILTSDMPISSAHKLWLKQSILKKFQDDVLPDADAKCLAKFLESNDSCRAFNLKPRSNAAEEAIGTLKWMLYDVFVKCGTDPYPTLSSFAEGCGLGPGANLNSESYDFYTKLFNSPLSRTSDLLYRHYRYAIIDQPYWFHAELMRGVQCGDVMVDGSRLTFVPKTREISRTVCTEPTLNMMFQKWIGSYLESELKGRFKIDLSYQPEVNRDLAYRGSIDGSFGTIDLSSASDSISCNLCREIFPKSFSDLLFQTRSPLTILPSGEKVKLDMISSMGNGYTFPLQTLIFASLVVACYRVMGIKPQFGKRAPANFAVFGDDIIVRKDAYDFVVECLETLGFRVNVDKSFNVGHFRESCGGDFFRGHNIRGVYIKSLKQDSLVYSAVNRLLRWSARTDLPLFNTVSYLLSGIEKRKILFIPYTDGDDEGLKVPKAYATSTVWCRTTYSTKYRVRKNVPTTYRIGEGDSLDEAVVRTKLPGFKYNPSGLLLTFLGSYIRYGRISVRSDRAKAKVVWRYSSSWDWIPDAESRNYSQGCGWYTMVGLHLLSAGLGG